MRRKLKSDSTMKTITYGLFIYVCLTTFNGIFAHSPKPALSPTKPECDLQSIIKKSKYVVDCLSTTTNAPLPQLTFGTRGQYLCTGIFGIVDKICEINPTPINKISFDVSIEELRSHVGNDRTKFCSLIKDSISKTSKNLIINSTLHSNINKLNDNFIPQCGIYCYENEIIAVHPLCVLLYGINEDLISFKKPESHNPDVSQQKKTTEPEISKPSLSSAAQSITKNAETPKNNTESTTSPEILQSSHKEKKPKPKAAVANSSTENSNLLQKTASSFDQNGAGGAPGIPAKKNEAQQEKNANDGSETVADAVANIKVPDGTDVQNEEKSLASGTGDVTLGNAEAENIKQGKSDTGTESGGEQHQKNLAGDDVGGFNGDGEDTDAEPSENLDPPPTELRDDATAAGSNHGEGDKSSGKSEKAKTDRESVYPQDHTLVNSGGPPDPPQHFFAYFVAVSFICIICYIGYHKKHKIMGIIFEGRKSRGGRGRRRPNTAGYRKLDCNLEEAVTSQCNSNVTHVIY